MKKKFNVVFEMKNGITIFDSTSEKDIDKLVQAFNDNAELTSLKIYQCLDGARGKGAYGLVTDISKKMKMGFVK